MEYFTPSIEDIRVGYECEVKQEESWYPILFTGYEVLSFFKEKGELRVPYLTKEQIEKEGWAVSEWEGLLKCKKENYGMDYNPTHHVLRIARMEPYKVLIEGEEGVKCKDINTFRYICKLLNI